MTHGGNLFLDGYLDALGTSGGFGASPGPQGPGLFSEVGPGKYEIRKTAGKVAPGLYVLPIRVLHLSTHIPA